MLCNSFTSTDLFAGAGRFCANTKFLKRDLKINAIDHQYHELNNNFIADDPLLSYTRLIDKIKMGLLKVELSISAYDTAWVAMVPSTRFQGTPCFPECVDWILDNQLSDGSWTLKNRKPFSTKDILSSTLACVLALKRWNIGEEYINKGLSFIGSSFSASMNEKLPSPVGYNIIFPGMISNAIGMGLDLPIRESDINAMFSVREIESKFGSKAYHAFVAEGLYGTHDWREVMSYQRRNGSLFNSPSATAAALCHVRDDKLLSYLSSVLQKFGCAVPTICPLDIHVHLSMVDKLEKLGISSHFIDDIRKILDRVYRCWVENDEEVHSDITTCAMAFRLLRMHGYDVSSDALSRFADVRDFKNTVQGHIGDLNAAVELHKASQVQISPDESVLKRLNSWVTHFLQEEVNRNIIDSPHTSEEIEYALSHPFYANLERLEHKRNIEHYNLDDLQMLKTSYASNINSIALLELAVTDFSSSQSKYRNEIQNLESWVKEWKLDQLDFSRQKQAYCYFSAAGSIFSFEMSDARLCWAKNCVLTTIIDDFFDGGGSSKELANLIALVEKWHGFEEKDFCSKSVKIIFYALYNTVNDLGAKASLLHKREVNSCIIKSYLRMMNGMMKEAEWQKSKILPTIDEYMIYGISSVALDPIILSSLFYVGSELSENFVESPEFYTLYKLIGKLGRLLNDIQSFEREKLHGKMNSLSILLHHGNGSVSEEDARKQMLSLIDSARAELLGIVLRNKGSFIPRACKDLFWKMAKVLNLFYRNNDGYTLPNEMVANVNAVIHEPLKVSKLRLRPALHTVVS